MSKNSLQISHRARRAGAIVVFLAGSLSSLASAQYIPVPDPKAPPQASAPAPDPLEPLAWLEGCWLGEVNERQFREQWMPSRGKLMPGVSHTVRGGATVGFEYLRVEPRADAIYYIVLVPGKPETAYKLVNTSTDAERGDTIFEFANPAADFPQTIIYRRGSGGWLYATVEGKAGGKDRQVIYPMRRIDCGTGELIRK